MLLVSIVRHWLQSIGGTSMAVIGFVADAQDWQVPGRAWWAVSVVFFVWAIVKAYHELRIQSEAATEELTDYRDHKRIADAMLLRFQAGNRLLTHLPPPGSLETNTWIIEANRWMKETLDVMAEVGCNPHDVNWVEPTGGFGGLGGNYASVLHTLQDRVGRVGQVGDIYQGKVEAAKKPRTLAT